MKCLPWYVGSMVPMIFNLNRFFLLDSSPALVSLYLFLSSSFSLYLSPFLSLSPRFLSLSLSLCLSPRLFPCLQSAVSSFSPSSQLGFLVRIIYLNQFDSSLEHIVFTRAFSMELVCGGVRQWPAVAVSVDRRRERDGQSH